MTILAIDTTGPSAGVALLRNGRVVSSFRRSAGLTHSETLMPMLETVLSGEGLSPKDIDRIACAVGPGSFTGVRIGVCAAKGIAEATGCEVCAVDALEALAYAHKGFHGVICPVLDARRGQVYGAAFRFESGERPVRILHDQAIQLTDFLTLLPEGETRLFTGDAVSARETEILSASGTGSVTASANSRDIDPAAVAALGAMESPMDGIALEPLYLRASQAERERLEKQKNG